MRVELVVETELSSSLDQLWTKSVHAATCATLFVRSVLKPRARNFTHTLDLSSNSTQHRAWYWFCGTHKLIRRGLKAFAFEWSKWFSLSCRCLNSSREEGEANRTDIYFTTFHSIIYLKLNLFDSRPSRCVSSVACHAHNSHQKSASEDNYNLWGALKRML